MRDRQPLLALQQGAKGAAPARDFKAALRSKMEQTGARERKARPEGSIQLIEQVGLPCAACS